MAKRKSITLRTAERLHRAAYDYEYLAVRLRADGFENWANEIRDISSRLGHAARALEEILTRG